MSKKHKKFFTTLNYIEHFLMLVSIVKYVSIKYVSISAFASLVSIPIAITSSATGLKICAITAAIKKYKSMIKKTKKRHGKIVLLAKSKLNSIEVLISKALIDSVVSHHKFVLINNILKEYDEMKEEIKNLKT